MFLKLQEKAGKVQTKANTANTSGPFFYDDVGVAYITGCGCGFVRMRIKTIQTSNKNFISDVGMEKEQKQELGWRVSVLPIPAFHHCEPELGWRVSVLPIPAFHHCEPLCVACTQCTVECRNV